MRKDTAEQRDKKRISLSLLVDRLQTKEEVGEPDDMDDIFPVSTHEINTDQWGSMIVYVHSAQSRPAQW